MKRLRMFSSRAMLSTVLVFALSVMTAITPTHVGLVALSGLAVTNAACGVNDLSKLHDTLNETAKALNAAIKTNGQLYDQGVYGPIGSAEAVARLHRGAQIIKDANAHLITALNLAKGLTKETFEPGKLAVLQALTAAVSSMPSTGNQTMDLILQSVATLINQAVVIVQVFKAKDLPRALPEIKTWRWEVSV